MTEEEALEKLNQLMTETFPHYVLDGHTPVKATDFLTFMAWYEATERHVARALGDGWELSTVFLGVAVHQTRDREEGLPPLFETCLFREGAHAQVLARYHTWEQAAAGHASWLEGVQAEYGLSCSGPKEP